MSQIRKIKRKREKNKAVPTKGKSAFIWLVVMAVILIAVVAFLGFRNISTAPTPESVNEAGSVTNADELEAISLTTTSDERVLVSDLMNQPDRESIFVFFLGAG